MSQHKPRLLGAARAYINGTHSAQPTGQLITGQAERLRVVCAYVGAHVCVHAAGEGVAWVGVRRSVFLKDTPSLQPTWFSPQVGREGPILA